MLYQAESNDQRDARLNAELLPQWEHEKEWHKWFAWKPVFVAPNQKAWMRTVERRLGWLNRKDPPKWWYWHVRYLSYEYRLPTDK